MREVEPSSAVTPEALAQLEAAGRLAALRSRPEGLTSAEAAQRLTRYGPNEPGREQRGSAVLAFAANFSHTLALLLWFAAGLAFAAGAPELGGAIVAVVVVNGVFAFVQEHRAEQVIRSLIHRVSIQATVVRDGTIGKLPAAGLVPGDVVHLAAGDITPADGVLLDADSLTLDLSMITGESVPVERDAAREEQPATGAPIFDLRSIVPAGSAVITGSGQCVVFGTGRESSMGKIAWLVAGVQREDSVLEKQIAQLSRVTAVIAVVAGAVTLSLTRVFTETEFITALTFATGVIVALVPEGLLPTLSVSLAIGARRMATRGAAARRLSAVEVVGSVTVICTDKTGTLTENALRVLGALAANGDAGHARLLQAAVLCNDAQRIGAGYEGDPLEVALLRWTEEQGLKPEAVQDACPRVDSVPFDSQRRYMSVTCEIDGRRQSYIKGAPEAVVALARKGPSAQVGAALDDATAKGERVLLFAQQEEGAPAEIIGLVRFADPPRQGVAEAVAACRRAGIRIVMLTGDHPSTALSLARTIGLGNHMRAVQGPELEQMDDRSLGAALSRDVIFARIDPSQKLRIVSLLQRAGEVVVVTGDGINDAPALRAADVGIAMGLRGTEVAKQAADVVLADDNFATIVAAIEEGRAIRTNIRRFASYVFTSNVAELAPFLLYIFLPIPLPLAIIQVLAIDLGTDLLPALALGTERAHPGVMAAQPESQRAPLLTRALFLRTFLFYGLLEACLGLGAFFAYYASEGWRPFESLDDSIAKAAATLTFLGIVSGQIGCLFASRDGALRQRLSLRVNPWVAAGLTFEIVLALALVYVPGLNGVFSMATVSPLWLAVLPLGAALFLAADMVRRRLGQSERPRVQPR